MDVQFPLAGFVVRRQLVDFFALPIKHIDNEIAARRGKDFVVVTVGRWLTAPGFFSFYLTSFLRGQPLL
jgi:hypothetical protein